MTTTTTSWASLLVANMLLTLAALTIKAQAMELSLYADALNDLSNAILLPAFM